MLGILINKNNKEGVMKTNQGGVKLSLIVISIIVLGVSAWFNQPTVL
ncbi:signal peptide [Pseudoalteromonas sp. BSi20495]|nr:signal peptide [Pseudoalteromonas sp. BSi20495]